MIPRKGRRIYLWIGFAALALAFAIGSGANGALAGLPSQVVASPPMPAAGQQAKPVTSIAIKIPGGNAIVHRPAAPDSILYDQYNSPGGSATGSQQFGTASDDQAADDFVVPSPGWRITQVDVNGSYSIVTSTTNLANVYFYSNAISGTYSIPGAAVYTATNQVTTLTTSGAFVVSLTSPAVLTPGSYWVSVQATGMATGQWFWQDRSVQSTNKAAWRNPPGGFGTACNNWDQRSFCIPGDAAAADQEFRLWGDPVGALTSTPTNTSTATPTRPPCGGGPNWIVGNPFPDNVVRAGGVWFPANGKFYAMGGRASDTAGSDYLNPHEFTPGGQGSWTTKAGTFDDNQVNNMPAAVLNQGGTDYIFTVGGSAAGATTTTYKVRRYDPVADVITVVTTDPWPQALSNILPGGFAVYNNKLYIFGGFQVAPAPATGISDIWEFDPNAPAGSMWTQKSATLPVAMAYVPAATIGSFIYTAGGDTFDVNGLLNDSTNSYKYDPNADSITTIAAIPRATGETRGLNVDGQMWVMGGGRITPNPSNEVDIYDPGTDSWTTGLSFLGARRNFPVDVRPGTGDRIYLAGGYQPTTASSDMQIYALAAPCIPTFTATRTPTATRTRTATPSPTCPPVLTTIGRGDPGKAAPVRRLPNASSSLSAAKSSGKSIRAGFLPGPTDNAPVAFELDDGTHENSIGFGSTVSNTESAAIWLNRFTPPAGAYPITLSKINILWPTQTVPTDTIIGKTARLLVYLDADGNNDPSNATLVYQQFVTVGVTETFQTYNLSSPPTIAGPTGDLYIGFEDFWAESGSFQPRMFPAAEDSTPPSQRRSWIVAMGTGGAPNVATLSANDTIGIIDDLNPAIGGNWMIRASGISSLSDPCPATRTSTPTATATSTATVTPAVTPQLVVHLTWQGISQPNSRNTTETLTTTLRLTTGGPDVELGPNSTDANGTYTLPVGSLPNGTYTIRAKGPRNLSNGAVSCDTVTLTGALITNKELGTMRAGDASSVGATNFNVVNATDFTTLKATFGKSFGQPGYDARADFNNSDNVDATDFTLLKNNFGSAGCPNP